MYTKNTNPPAPVALGDKYRFKPSAFTGADPGGGNPVVGRVTGKVIYIHATHRFFTVEYEIHGKRLRENFKFDGRQP